MVTKKFWSQLTGAGTSNKQTSSSKQEHQTLDKQSKQVSRNAPAREAPLGTSQQTLVRTRVASNQITPILAPQSPATMLGQLELSSKGKKKKSKKVKLLSSKSFRPLVNLNLQLSTAVRERVMKTRQAGQSFTRLTDELASPPSKLYSPFNIVETPGENSLSPASKLARRKLENELASTSSASDLTKSRNESSGFIDCSFESSSANESSGKITTPKERAALQHKHHLMQANKFAFDSPTGKLRETVKDVEHFQECIEAISRAIVTKRSQ